MLDWTRYRTLRIINALPTNFISYPIKSLEGQPFDTPGKILEHIAFSETVYFSFILGGKTMPEQDFSFINKSKVFIVKKIEDIRKSTNEWLEQRKDIELDELMFNRRTTIGWVFHHLPEHEAHHIGQICVLALMAGHNVPNI